MKITRNIFTTIFSGLMVSFLLMSCGDSQSPGVEYMPDMYRSPAIEAYVDYEFPDSATNRQAPANSIPQGYKPYAYENSSAGFESAGENLKNPLHLTEKSIAQGKVLYNSFCAHCHGKKGLGEGTITHAIYGAVPSYTGDAPNRRGGRSMIDLKEGHIYHTIMYGLNAMGPHSSLIREDDRWKIVAYVQTLQGKDPLNMEQEEMAAPSDSLK